MTCNSKDYSLTSCVSLGQICRFTIFQWTVLQNGKMTDCRRCGKHSYRSYVLECGEMLVLPSKIVYLKEFLGEKGEQADNYYSLILGDYSSQLLILPKKTLMLYLFKHGLLIESICSLKLQKRDLIHSYKQYDQNLFKFLNLIGQFHIRYSDMHLIWR